MHETLHLNQRARQRGITNKMIELTLEFGSRKADKICLGIRRIKKLLQTHKDLKTDLLKILDKGGLIVVFANESIVTAYRWS